MENRIEDSEGKVVKYKNNIANDIDEGQLPEFCHLSVHNITSCHRSLPIPQVLVRYISSLAFNSLYTCRWRVLSALSRPSSKEISCFRSFHQPLETPCELVVRSAGVPLNMLTHRASQSLSRILSQTTLASISTERLDHVHYLGCLNPHPSSLLFRAAVRSCE